MDFRSSMRKVISRLGHAGDDDQTHMDLVLASGMFDSGYYLENHPDVAGSGSDPLQHYLELGWEEGRNPSRDFDNDWYLERHLSGPGLHQNPLIHYLREGRSAGLEIRPVESPDIREIRASGLFDREYYLDEYPDVAESGIDALTHYVKYGAAEGRNPSRYFNTRYYQRNNPDVAIKRINPLLHFCRHGWKELRNPSPEFDVWWYWSNHMDPAIEGQNPLAHYLAIGQAKGLETRPSRGMGQLPGSGFRYPAGHCPRRICMFAAYDPDGLVDDHVVAYVRELSRFADVYFMADCHMQPGQLERLAPYVKHASSGRHGEYDFGSYRRLVEHVGWKAINEYDELLLVNDSCYLLKPLDQVFSGMDARACDWWGMQATKGMAGTRNSISNQFRAPIPMAAVRGKLLDVFEQDYRYDFHVGSYFLCYRKPVISDDRFQHMLGAVAAQSNKRNLILKYEIGLTRWLISNNYAFDTFIDHLYPFHPIYTKWYFSLLDQGFPLLKRYLLSENHYAVAGLKYWETDIKSVVPGADTETIARHLERVVDPDTLHRNLNLGVDAAVEESPEFTGMLHGDAFRAADHSSPKYSRWWAFPVCSFTQVFSGNERAVFEEVRDDPSIRKIVLAQDRPVEVEGNNVEVVPLRSPRGQYLLMRCGNIFIKHSPTRNLIYPLAPHLHNIINLWHGIPFKRIGYASLDMLDKLPEIAKEHAKCRAVISSSRIDTLAMAASFHPLSYHDVWMTGLPRNDFILREFDALPQDMREEALRVRNEVGGRKLILFMPTFRNKQADAYYRFSPAQIAFLRDWLAHENAVFGVREHMADNARTYGDQFKGLPMLDLSSELYPNAEILYRESAALITDYSSSFIDYMLTGKPALSFAYDEASYTFLERGGYYDLDMIFPGNVCRNFRQLEAGLQSLFEPASDVEAAALRWKRSMFFEYFDDQNSRRLADRVRQLSNTTELGRRIT